MGFHNILSKVDQALVAYLIQEGAGSADDVFASKRAGNNPDLPYTVCIATDWDELQEYSATLKVEAIVEVHTNAAPNRNEDTDDMRLDSDERVQATGDALFKQNTGSDGAGLADGITSAGASAAVTVLSARCARGKQGKDEKAGEWIDIFTLELVCMPR